MKLLVILFTLFSFTISNYAQEERKLIRKGNEEYEKKNYSESEAKFKEALQKNSKSYEAQFNYADALYKQEHYDEALAAFQALAAKETDKMRLAAINHNIGNCHLAISNKQQSAPNGQESQNNGASLDNAISSYKQSLRTNPQDNETRYNLIAAEKMKEDQKKKKDQNQQQQKQEQQQQQQQQDVSKQDAQRILDAMQEEEKKLQENKKVKASGRSSDKNW